MVSVRHLRLPELKIFASPVHEDERGGFFEAWNARALSTAGLHENFVQDNCVRSRRGALRGLHYQLARPQGKLVRVIRGAVFDVAVDLRRSSPTFGEWVSERLTADDHHALWIPPGFAHGYLALSDDADVYYKCTEFHDPAGERAVRWNDPALAVDWPLAAVGTPIVSPRDAAAPLFANAEPYP